MRTPHEALALNPVSPRSKVMNRLSAPVGPRKCAAANLLSRRRLYPGPSWAFLTEVRNRVGPAADDALRVADAVAVNLWDGWWWMHGFELKTSRADWRRELRHPE